MSLFGCPKCPHCGGKLVETGYCMPYPAWRCPTCIKRNRENEELEEYIASLESRAEELESEHATI